MRKDSTIFLIHISESIEWIEKETNDISKDKFIREVPIQDAAIRRLEIIGEAVKNLPGDFKKKYPAIPWQKISGLRDKLIHGYFGVDLGLVWEIIKKDLPTFKKQIQQMLKG
ncbi:DUF86 domain-containing protein [Candidatus Daviesbacteria bacterium]|nr:DUF86 domain-containing protein [Candidatus Daviesbacteria bacterium]